MALFDEAAITGLPPTTGLTSSQALRTRRGVELRKDAEHTLGCRHAVCSHRVCTSGRSGAPTKVNDSAPGHLQLGKGLAAPQKITCPWSLEPLSLAQFCGSCSGQRRRTCWLRRSISSSAGSHWLPHLTLKHPKLPESRGARLTFANTRDQRRRASPFDETLPEETCRNISIFRFTAR